MNDVVMRIRKALTVSIFSNAAIFYMLISSGNSLSVSLYFTVNFDYGCSTSCDEKFTSQEKKCRLLSWKNAMLKFIKENKSQQEQKKKRD
jgi:hypothetical protein